MSCKHYYFSGAYSQPLKIRLNIDQLFSIYHEEKLVTKIIQYKREHPEYTAALMLDSGAFSHFQNMKKKGLVLSDKDVYEYTDKYIEFLNEWGDDLTCFVGVDTVPDPTNVDPTFIHKTWDNYLYMYERLKPSIRHKLIPVFHFGEDFEALKRWLEFRHPDGNPVDYIGLAISLEGDTKTRISWGQQCMRIIAESSNPNVKTHAFGVGVKAVLEHIDVWSTDATSWVKRAAYGMIGVNDKPYTVSDVQKEMLSGKHYSERSLAYSTAVDDAIKERGFKIEPVTTSYCWDVGNQTIRFTIEGQEHIIEYIDAGHIRLDNQLVLELDSQLETENEVDKFYGKWVGEDKVIITIDGDHTLIYDDGKCLATNCYARAEFNILDTLDWMKDIENKKVTLTKKAGLW